MQFEAEYITWDQAQRIVREGGAEAFVDAISAPDKTPGLLELATGELGDSSILAWEVGETGMEIAEILGGEQGESMEAIVAIIGPGGEYTAQHSDLPFDGDELTFSIISPERAGQVAAKIDHLDMAAVAEAFAKAETPAEQEAITSFAEFEENLRAWRDILRTASESGRGLRFMMY